MNLKDLGREISYKWRVQSFSKFKPSATCVAYIDARAVMDLLDDVVGAANWQDKYEVVHNHLYASIGINVGTALAVNWVWKTDCGVESNMEAEKGEASDAFKRAAVKWAVGRFLYALEVRRVQANKVADGKGSPHVVDTNGKRVWNLTEYINGLNGKSVIKGQNGKKTVSFPQGGRKGQKPAEKGKDEPSEPKGDFFIAGREVSKERYIESIFSTAKKHDYDLSKIINTEYDGAEPEDLDCPKQLLEFGARVSEEIKKKIEGEK